MKKLIKITLSAAVTAPLLVFAAVSAAPETPDDGSSRPAPVKVTSETESNQSGTESQTTMRATTESSGDTAELKKRLEERKARLKTKLTILEQNRLQNRCQNSQGKFSSLNGRIKGIETSRTQVYGALIDRLTALESRLETHGADTTKLQADIDALKAKIETFNTDLAAYKQTVADLAAMDCKADPAGFKASLETARAALQKVKQDAADIRTYVNETVKVTLKDIRSQLEGTKTETEPSGTDSSDERSR